MEVGYSGALVAGKPCKSFAGGGRARALARARDGLAYLWVEFLGHSGQTLARALALHPVSVYRAARRGQEQRAKWERLVR